MKRFPEMNVAASPGASIDASAQIYPDSKPAEVPHRPAWTGVDTRVSKNIGTYTRMSLTERPERGGNLPKTSPI